MKFSIILLSWYGPYQDKNSKIFSIELYIDAEKETNTSNLTERTHRHRS